MNATQTLLALAELCISVCRMDPGSGLCLGCWRDIDEIIAWGRMGEDTKREVWRSISMRMAAQID